MDDNLNSTDNSNSVGTNPPNSNYPNPNQVNPIANPMANAQVPNQGMNNTNPEMPSLTSDADVSQIPEDNTQPVSEDLQSNVVPKPVGEFQNNQVQANSSMQNQNDATVSNPVPPTPPNDPDLNDDKSENLEEKKKMKLLPTLLLLLLMLALGLGIGLGVVYFLNRDSSDDLDNVNNEIENEQDVVEDDVNNEVDDSTNQPADEGGAWKKYENDEYGISLSYPGDWELEAEESTMPNTVFSIRISKEDSYFFYVEPQLEAVYCYYGDVVVDETYMGYQFSSEFEEFTYGNEIIRRAEFNDNDFAMNEDGIKYGICRQTAETFMMQVYDGYVYYNISENAENEEELLETMDAIFMTMDGVYND